VPAAIWLLAKAMGKSASMPMTSPVLRISGPRMTSTPGNLAKGKTTSFTAVCFGGVGSTMPSSASDLPIISLAAILAKGWPWALETKGTVRLARGLTAWTAEDRKGMDAWLAEYAHWLATSKEAADERNAKNNHGTWFDVHEASLLLYLGKTDEARAVCERAKTKRIAVQIEPDGRMPLELARADGWGYSTFNARALTELATLAQRVDVDLWHHETPDGRSIRRALDYLAAYTDPEKKWQHNQMNNFNRAAILPALLRGQVAYGEAAYAEALGRLPAEAVARERTRLSTGK
jgi:hypothetical protein